MCPAERRRIIGVRSKEAGDGLCREFYKFCMRFCKLRNRVHFICVQKSDANVILFRILRDGIMVKI